LQKFIQLSDEFYSNNCRVVIVTRDSYKLNAKFDKENGHDLDILSDPSGAITNGYCGLRGKVSKSIEPSTKKNYRHNSTYIIDPNQRIAIGLHKGSDHTQKIIEYLQQLKQRLESNQVTQRPPLLMLPDVFNLSLCKELIAGWRGEHFEGLITVGSGFKGNPDKSVVASSVKRRLDHRLSEGANSKACNLVGRRVAPILHKAFQFCLGSVQHFRVGAYSADRGDFFKAHRDNDTPATEKRCFAMSVNLNDDYVGGNLIFPEFGKELYRPPIGGGLIFSCSLLHEALPVTSGTRFVALTFFFAPIVEKGGCQKRLPGLGG